MPLSSILAAEQNRNGLATQADQAVRLAQTSAQARDAAAAGAATARDGISSAVTALCDALSASAQPSGTGAAAARNGNTAPAAAADADRKICRREGVVISAFTAGRG